MLDAGSKTLAPPIAKDQFYGGDGGELCVFLTEKIVKRTMHMFLLDTTSDACVSTDIECPPLHLSCSRPLAVAKGQVAAPLPMATPADAIEKRRAEFEKAKVWPFSAFWSETLTQPEADRRIESLYSL